MENKIRKKKHVVKENEQPNTMEKLQQRQKLDTLLKALKKYQKQKEKTPVQQIKRPENYKHRFEAQRNTIEKLSLKLEEKERVIEELKLGIFDKEALREINETKIQIREIFADCTPKIRVKITPPIDLRDKLMISTQKAPKIIQEMEEKALERAKRRDIILERKRIIEMNRQKMVAEAIERKKIQDEEEKKRNLEVIKERRQKELERDKLRQMNKMVFLEKLKKGIEFSNYKLLSKGFSAFLANYRENQWNEKRAVLHHRISLQSKMITIWKGLLEEKYREKNALADATFSQNMLNRSFEHWKNFHIENVRNMQVAEDFHDFNLLHHNFVHWHRYVCIQIMLGEKKMHKAKEHCNKRLLFQSFFQWRSLKAINELERAKEMKLKKWREKVWAILPDYKPPNF